MKTIYFDNAATSFPKPPQVAQRMAYYLNEVGCNIGRGGYAGAYDAAQTVLETREQLCRLFHFPQSSGVIFTASVTVALNMLLKGLLRAGEHLISSSVEHNAVLRPIAQLAAAGVECSWIKTDMQGRISEQELGRQLAALLRPNTKAVVLTHASNVGGALLPIGAAGAFCRAHGLLLIVDCAQTGGVQPIDMEEMGIDALAFTGHKGLMGPQGIGGFLVSERMAQRMEPLISGGTGSFSELAQMPPVLPDRFEAGTLNLPGIFGLNVALEFLEKTGLSAIRERERLLTERFLARAGALSGVRIIGPRDAEERVAVVSLDFPGRDNAEIAFLLDSQFGIMTRCGLHCAPDAHKSFGSYPQGTVRFSFGWFNTPEEIDRAADALEQILR